jgi:hypothetical protein
MHHLKRYTIEVSAEAQDVGQFVANFAEDTQYALELNLDAFKCTDRFGSSESWRPQDFRDMVPNSNESLSAVFIPNEDTSVEFSSSDRIKTLRIISGTLALSGALELPDDDPFAMRVKQGFTASPAGWFELTRRIGQERFRTMLGIFEAPSDQTRA